MTLNRTAMPKVLHVITRMDMGGSAQNTLLTCIGLAKKYRMILVYGVSKESGMTEAEKHSVESGVARARRLGVDCIVLPSLVRSIHPLRDLLAFFALLRLMLREKPDVAHTHTSKAGLLGRWAAWISRVPNIVHTAHGHVFYGHFSAPASKLFLLMERVSALVTDRMVALTDREKQDYIAFSVADPEKIDTIHSGVNIDLYIQTPQNPEAKKRSLGLTSDGCVVGTVGWLLPIKGPMHLLDAMIQVWRKRPDVELAYVGKGDLEKALKQRAEQMGVSQKVKFLGWRNDVHEIMPVFDVFVLPSLNEGMGRVLVEAMAAGRPLVASNAGGIPDLVAHGRNGLLVEPGDVKDLAAAIETLLADEQMRKQMGKRGRSLARTYSEQGMIEKIDALYASFLGPRTSKGRALS